VLRLRLAACLSALLLAAPAAAFAQGAGDDQYQDPFGDQPVQNDGGSGEDGLSDEPPVGGNGNGNANGGGDPGGAGDPEADDPARRQLPNTGSDPRPLAALGVALLLVGAGMRLRSRDPDAY
jgi:LPXTG-motif cell wall-anchored protein